MSQVADATLYVFSDVDPVGLMNVLYRKLLWVSR